MCRVVGVSAALSCALAGPLLLVSLHHSAPSMPCSRDWDDLCAYKTDVKVLIRHKTIGCLYYSCMLAILGGYVIGYEYVIKQGWGNLVDLSGSLRATCKSPEAPAPVDMLPYCSQAKLPTGAPPAVRLPCMSLDDEATMQVSSMGVLVGTRLSMIHEHTNPNCGELEYPCTRWVPERRVDAFVGDIESHTVLVQHAVAPSFIQKMGGREVIDVFHNRSFYPELRGPEGTATAVPCAGPLDPVPECPDAGDLIRVGDLINISGQNDAHLDLDAPLKSPGHPDTSLRSEGLTMRINLVYEGYSHYYYRVSTNAIKAKVTSSDWYNSSTRVIQDLHGIQLIFAQSGGVRLPDVKTMLLTLVSGLVMLSTAKTIADYFLLYVAPKRAKYRLFTEMITPDFGPENDAERAVLDKIVARKQRERDEILGLGLTDQDAFLPEGPGSGAMAGATAHAGSAEGRRGGMAVQVLSDRA